MGFNAPSNIIIKSKKDLLNIPYDNFIFKPRNDSNRVGVVGPIINKNPNLILKLYNRSLSQVSNGHKQIICEDYIVGDPYRVNVNHGKITFVAKSVKFTITGDGVNSIQQLINSRRKKLGYKYFVSDEYFLNILLCENLSMETILSPGVKIAISHDGNEEGYFIDVSDKFDSNIKKDALILSNALQCPVLGLDVIVNNNKHWYVDVNTNPGIDFFGKIDRAYDTMNHMIIQLMNTKDIRLKSNVND